MGKIENDNVVDPNSGDDSIKPTADAKVSKRTEYSGIGGDNYPFTDVPTDYSFDNHKPLKKRDFAEEYQYLEYRAKEAEAKAAEYRKEAEECKKLGSSSARAAAKRLVKMTEKMGELAKQLKAAGVDVDALMANTKA